MPKYIPKWEQWNDEIIKDTHGEVRFYRDLYYGNHGKIFPRAKALIENGEIIENLRTGRTYNPDGNVQTPYLVANASKIIVNTPAVLVSRAIGKLSLDKDQEFEREVSDEFPKGKEYLSDLLEKIERDSGFVKGAHKQNIIHLQMDGGIVGMPVKDDNGIRIEFKKREVYYPHDDGLGCDLVFKRKLENMQGKMEDFLHVHRHRVEDNTLTIDEFLFRLEDNQLQEVEEDEAKQILEVNDLHMEFKNRNKQLVSYLANEPTFDYPLGMSALWGQANKQDEINWVLTRNSIVFQRNGKPRLGVSKEVMGALQQKALERYGDETKIDHRDLEIFTIDSQGKSMEIIQIDVSKIGDIKYVKDIMKVMFIETQTSEKAVDFYMDEGSPAQSGIAKFYDLFTSIIKAEDILAQYVDFIQELVENAFWLMSQDKEYETIEVVKPSIQIKDMIPTAKKEVIDTEVSATGAGLRSKEKAVRNINPEMSDTAIEQELENIEADGQSINSQTGAGVSMNNLSSLLDNRNPDGTPKQQDGQTGQAGQQQQSGQTGQPQK